MTLAWNGEDNLNIQSLDLWDNSCINIYKHSHTDENKENTMLKE